MTCQYFNNTSHFVNELGLNIQSDLKRVCKRELQLLKFYLKLLILNMKFLDIKFLIYKKKSHPNNILYSGEIKL